ncbi:MAG: YfbM family protein [Chlorobium sp.]|nr:YfbM family protein [Chlorobium sp.]
MSMLFSLRRIAKERADFLMQDSSDIFFFLHGNEPYQPPKGFSQKLFGLKKETKPQRNWEPPEEGTLLDLDKNWHLMHYLLSRTPWEGPMPQASLMGGSEIGNVDVGYGPARLLNPRQVGEFLDYLDLLSENEFGTDVTAAELEDNEIYGAYPEWSSEDPKVLWEYVKELKTFFSKAKATGEFVVLYLY